jgi:hypothetical protein
MTVALRLSTQLPRGGTKAKREPKTPERAVPGVLQLTPETAAGKLARERAGPAPLAWFPDATRVKRPR